MNVINAEKQLSGDLKLKSCLLLYPITTALHLNGLPALHAPSELMMRRIREYETRAELDQLMLSCLHS